MSKDIAVGIVIGGAVSASLGAALGKTQHGLDGLQKRLGDTSNIRKLIGETQRLQREMDAADNASRQIGVTSYQKIRAEMKGLAKEAQASTGTVADLTNKLSAAQQAATLGKTALPSLQAEHEALARNNKLLQAQAEIKRATWQDARNNTALSQQEKLASKQAYEATREQAKQARALTEAKRAQVQATKAQIAAEGQAQHALDKAVRQEKRAQEALASKRTELKTVTRAHLETKRAVASHAAQVGMLGNAVQRTDKALRYQLPVIGDATRATSKLSDANRSAVTSQQQLANSPLRDRLAANIGALRSMGIEVGKLDIALQKLSRTEKGMQWQQAGLQKMQSGLALGRTAGLAIGSAAIPTRIAGNFQAEIRDIAIKGGIAGKPEELALAKSIKQTAEQQKMSSTDLAQAINGLVTQGMEVNEATTHGNLLAELIKGQKMAPEDAAKLIFSFGQNGVKPEQMRKSMGEVAIAGDLGAFEADKMARYMPELLATTGALGFQGPEAVRYLSASLQAQVKLTGDPDSAANNLKNLLGKITAPDTAKKFEEASIDLQASMQAYIQRGYNPIEAFITLTERLQAEKDSGQAQKLAALKSKIQRSNNAGEENAALDAYLKMAGLADVLTDQQARAGALAQIKYGSQIEQDLAKMKTNDGGLKLSKDKADRDALSNSKWDAAKNSLSAALGEIGDAIRPMTDRIAELASSTGKFVVGFTQANPGVALGALAVSIGALGVAAKRITTGMVQWGAGRLLGGSGIRLPDTLSKTTGSLASHKGAAIGSRVLGVQPVLVTNWPGKGLPDLGGLSGKGSELNSHPSKRGRFARMREAIRNTRARIGNAVAASTPRSVGGALVRGAAKVGGAALVVGTAGSQVYDTFKNAKTSEEKGRGYSSAAGGLGGGFIGAKVGALVGSLVLPGIGTVIGGLVGSAVGVIAGEKLGGVIGSKIGQTVQSKTIAGIPAISKTPMAVVPATVAPPTKPKTPPAITQQLTFSPTIEVKVLGDAKNPQQIATSIAPHLKALFDQWAAQLKPSSSGRMYDPIGG
ncbi:phage tail tape measure protein [Chitinimonas sp. PSY-7]|uniref:phage tail tape measure protein n=1 Tax=Chitinimonas sp. PSY-7 TaxID=3459088 RepID=UPI00403FFEB7